MKKEIIHRVYCDLYKYPDDPEVTECNCDIEWPDDVPSHPEKGESK